jgi:hypothetical protein
LVWVTIVAMIGTSVGFVLATAVTETSVSQPNQWYGISNSAVSDFPNLPSVQITQVPSAVSGCSSGSVTLGTMPSDVTVGASSTVTCAGGDFAEELTLTSANNPSSGSFTMTVYTTYGSAATTGVTPISVTVPSTASGTLTVNIYVDYGTQVPPSGGISELDLIVQ